jgi:hypothetical protein
MAELEQNVVTAVIDGWSPIAATRRQNPAYGADSSAPTCIHGGQRHFSGFSRSSASVFVGIGWECNDGVDRLSALARECRMNASIDVLALVSGA